MGSITNINASYVTNKAGVNEARSIRIVKLSFKYAIDFYIPIAMGISKMRIVGGSHYQQAKSYL